MKTALPGAPEFFVALRLGEDLGDEVAFCTESSILHPFDIAHKVAQFFFHRLGPGFACTLPAGLFDERLDFVFEQSFGPAVMPGFVIRIVFTN